MIHMIHIHDPYMIHIHYPYSFVTSMSSSAVFQQILPRQHHPRRSPQALPARYEHCRVRFGTDPFAMFDCHLHIMYIYICDIYIYTCIDICIAIRLLIWRSSLKTNFCAFFAQKGGESPWPSQLLVLQNPMVDTRWEDGYHKKTSSNQS